MADVDLTAELARIRERAEYAKEYMQGDPMPSSLDDAPRLLAAVEAVLKLTVRWKNFAASGEECADELRAAIAREIGGTPQRGGGDSGA